MKNSSEVIEKLKMRNFQGSRVSSLDFSTLYTSLPHDLIKAKVLSLVKWCFNRESKIKVCLWNTDYAPAATKSKRLFLEQRSKSRSQGHWHRCHLKGHHKWSMHAKYEVSTSNGSKVIANVKIDNRQNKQTDGQTKKQTEQKQYAPDNSIRGIKRISVLQIRRDFSPTRKRTRIHGVLVLNYVKLLLSSWKIYMCNVMAWFTNKKWGFLWAQTVLNS